MKICYLHIGPHKTATTTLQAMLLANRDTLERHGLHYPSIGAAATRNKKQHHAFAAEILSGKDSIRQLALRDALSRAGFPDRIVISTETLNSVVARSGVRNRLASFFLELGYGLNVIAYIRPQLLSINSYFTQRLKKLHSGESFDQFVTRFTNLSACNHLRHYAELREDKRFSVNFAPFNGAVLRAGICFDFLTRLGIDAPDHGGFVIPSDQNIAPGPKTVAGFLRIARSLQKREVAISDEARFSVAHILRGLAQERGWNAQKFNGLTPAHKKTIVQKFSQPNEDFAHVAWSRSWREVFGEDEDAAMNKPSCLFDWGNATEEERQEVQAFVKTGRQLVAQLRNNETRHPEMNTLRARVDA